MPVYLGKPVPPDDPMVGGRSTVFTLGSRPSTKDEAKEAKRERREKPTRKKVRTRKTTGGSMAKVKVTHRDYEESKDRPWTLSLDVVRNPSSAGLPKPEEKEEETPESKGKSGPDEGQR
jgi:hypothetical protein